MIIYGIVLSKGEYEDYSSWINRCFTSKSTAQNYVDKYNALLSRYKAHIHSKTLAIPPKKWDDKYDGFYEHYIDHNDRWEAKITEIKLD